MGTKRAEVVEPTFAVAPPPVETRRWLAPLILVAAALLLLLPFVAKPLHVDDPMYVWSAQQIRAHPLDPYGFEVNWYGTAEPMARVMKNPPLVGYYLAAASLVLGWSEPALHLALLLPAIGVLLAVHRLARELGAQPMLAALTTLATPVFLVSASTVMSDVTMLCSFVWAIALWVRGLRQARTLPLVAASVLIATATLTKYFGLSLLPLLVAYALICAPGQWRRWLPPLALPLALLAAYQLWTRELYGHGLLLEIASYANTAREIVGKPVWLRLLNATSFLGGGALTVALVLLAGAERRELVRTGGVLVVVLAVAWAADPYPEHPLRRAEGVALGFWLQLALFVTAGLVILERAVRESIRRGRDPAALLLLLWLVGTLVFAGVFNWSVNGRATLAAAPAGALLAARHAERFRGWRRGALAGAVAIGVALSLACLNADATHAQAARNAALSIESLYGKRPGTIWFLGHWGFQHYMEQLGARPVDGAAPRMQTGDLLVQPRVNSYGFRYESGGDNLPVILNLAVERMPHLAMMEFAVHAGFYSDLMGPLPFGFGAVPPDFYRVMEIRGPLQPVTRR